MSDEERVTLDPQAVTSLVLRGEAAQVGRLLSTCNAPAPVVVNGGHYVGCQLPAGHDGQHQIRIDWARS